jgi:GH15 family glucan-1,4-alpha-glucosidase
LHKDYDNPLIFYRVVKNDNNKDSIFNKNDAVMLYVSDLYGKNFTQITPEDEHYVNYTLYSERKTILIKTIIDSDNDSSFTVVDETNFREMSLDKPAMGRSIFSNTLKDSLRSLL